MPLTLNPTWHTLRSRHSRMNQGIHPYKTQPPSTTNERSWGNLCPSRDAVRARGPFHDSRTSLPSRLTVIRNHRRAMAVCKVPSCQTPASTSAPARSRQSVVASAARDSRPSARSNAPSRREALMVGPTCQHLGSYVTAELAVCVWQGVLQ